MKRLLIAFLILNCCFAIKAYSHHGKKYLVTGSYEVPRPGSIHTLFATDINNDFGNRSYGLEPGLLLGVSHRFDIEVHTHHGIEEGEFHTEAVAVESRIGLFGNYSESDDDPAEEDNIPFGLGLLIEFEKGFHDHPDNYEGRAVAGAELGSYSIGANIIWQQAFDMERTRETRYAFGVKRTLSRLFGIGAEFDGNFSSITSAKITPGIYFSTSEQLDVKVGTSIGVSPSSNDAIIRLAIVYGIQ